MNYTALKHNILIVEDNIQSALLFEKLLQSHGYISKVATNGSEALEIISKENIDVILLDLMLPDIEGMDLCAQIKKNPKTKDISIIIVTAKSDDNIVTEAFRHGASDYLRKPIKQTEFFARIDTQIKLKTTHDMLTLELKMRTATEEKLTKFINNSKDGIYITDEKGRIVIWNNTLEKISETKKSHAAGKNIWDVLYQFLSAETKNNISVSSFQKPFLTMLKTGKMTKFNPLEEITTVTNKLRYISQTMFVIDSQEGYCIASIIKDMTNETLAEMSLRESEVRFRQLAETINDVFIIRNAADKRVLYVNPAFEKVFGINKESILRDCSVFLNSVVPENKKKIQEHLKNISDPKKYKDLQFRIKRPDGTIRWLWRREYPVFDLKKKLHRTIIVISDITERMEYELIIKENEEKYRTIFDRIEESFVIFEVGTFKVIEANRVFYERSGLTPKQLLNKPLLGILKKYLGVTKPVKEIKEMLKKGYGFFSVEYMSLHGEKIYLDISLKTYEFRGKKYAACVSRDVTERKKSEIIIKENEEKFRNIFENINEGVAIIDFETEKLLEANPASHTLSEYSTKELKSIDITSIANNFNHNKVHELFKNIEKGRCHTHQVEITTKTGKLKTYEESYRMLNYKGRKAILSISRDITERIELQRKIVQTVIQTEEKERSRFAKDLHDGLGPLISTAKLYLKTLEKITSEKQQIEKINKVYEIMNESVESIKSISNNISPHILSNFGLISAINSFINNISEASGINISFTSNIKHRLEEEKEIAFFRILTELINNTVKHSKAKKIEISLNMKIHELILTYYDNGKGLNFKQAKKGMGIINIINRVESFGGKIIFKSGQKQKGTLVTINIPII